MRQYVYTNCKHTHTSTFWVVETPILEMYRIINRFRFTFSVWTTGTFHRSPSSIHFEYSSQSKKVTFWYSYHKSRYNPQRSEYANDNLHIIIQPCGYHSTINNLWEKHTPIENMRTAAVQLTIRDNLIDYIGTFTVSIGTCLFRHTKNTFLLPTTDSFSLYTSRICNLQLSSTKSRLRG